MNRLSLVAAGFTFALIVLGTLVTKNEAGTSVPDWPFSFGGLIPSGHLAGPVLYEYFHRLLADGTALSVLVLFTWILFGEHRAWVKWVGALAVLLILAQIGLSGLRVRIGETDAPAIDLIHPFVAQLFLGVVVSLTVFTSPGWVRAGELRSGFRKAPTPAVFFVTTAATAALLIQTVIGTAYRYHLVGVVPHIAWAILTGALLLWASILVVRLEHGRDRTFPYLTRPARVSVWILLFELILGALAYLFGSGYLPSPGEPQPAVITAVIHSGFSDALLATEAVLLFRLYRMVPITETQA